MQATQAAPIDVRTFIQEYFDAWKGTDLIFEPVNNRIVDETRLRRFNHPGLPRWAACNKHAHGAVAYWRII
jgi:hypothetical protein